MTSDYHTVGAQRDRERAFGLLSRLVSSVERVATHLDERFDVCPRFAELQDGFDDPITIEYGAGEVIAASVAKHVRECGHAFCREQDS